MGHGYVGINGAVSLARGLRRARLTHLNLKHNAIGSVGAAALATRNMVLPLNPSSYLNEANPSVKALADLVHTAAAAVTAERFPYRE